MYVELIGGPFDGLRFKKPDDDKVNKYITLDKKYKSGKVYGCRYKYDGEFYRFVGYKK